MKVLLVHPDDSPLEGAWSQSRWDLVIDLGWAGEVSYREWGRRMGCPVQAFYGFGHGPEDFSRIAEILSPGLGILVDGYGLDWWEILAPLRIFELLQLVIAKRVARDLAGAELVGTRRHPLAELLGYVLGSGVRWVESREESALGRRLRSLRTTASLMSPAQILQVAFDKWDMDFRLRGRVTPRGGEVTSGGAVLLPSSYSNVTRVLNAYAKLLPDSKFLLVTTRKSGAIQGLSKNIRSRSLAGFAPVDLPETTSDEIRALEDGWAGMQARFLQGGEELSLATSRGWFNRFAGYFKKWLRIRDAWQSVLEREQISAVLCGDENNPMNRIPVLLARRRRLPAVHCDHGALDVLLPLRSPACGTYLVKGAMERDFLERTFQVDRNRIEEGAPSGHGAQGRQKREPGNIVFFSEQYELILGRSRILYEQVLPRLCRLARERGTRVKVKLHPFESLASRRRILEDVLPPELRRHVDLVQGELADEFLAEVWFAVTVESSVSVDCAIRGIPCFSCGWFVTPLVGYEKQFVQYGAALHLSVPEEIERIPEMLQGFESTAELRRGLWNAISPARLEALLQKS